MGLAVISKMSAWAVLQSYTCAAPEGQAGWQRPLGTQRSRLSWDLCVRLICDSA